jgi:hypothetical protein
VTAGVVTLVTFWSDAGRSLANGSGVTNTVERRERSEGASLHAIGKVSVPSADAFWRR